MNYHRIISIGIALLVLDMYRRQCKQEEKTDQLWRMLMDLRVQTQRLQCLTQRSKAYLVIDDLADNVEYLTRRVKMLTEIMELLSKTRSSSDVPDSTAY